MAKKSKPREPDNANGRSDMGDIDIADPRRRASGMGLMTQAAAEQMMQAVHSGEPPGTLNPTK